MKNADKSTHKAKDLNGNWVLGYPTEYDNELEVEKAAYVKINPSTLCERVRGTEFFEGDILIDENGTECILVWHELGWFVEYSSKEHYRFQDDGEYEPTGRNRHD